MERPEGTILGNINSLVALTYFPQKPQCIPIDVGSRTPPFRQPILFPLPSSQSLILPPRSLTTSFSHKTFLRSWVYIGLCYGLHSAAVEKLFVRYSHRSKSRGHKNPPSKRVAGHRRCSKARALESSSQAHR